MSDDEFFSPPGPRPHEASAAPDQGANDEAIRLRMLSLKQEHADLDAAIAAMEGGPAPVSTLALQRLKKRKLLIKDKIATLSDLIHPDITA